MLAANLPLSFGTVVGLLGGLGSPRQGELAKLDSVPQVDPLGLRIPRRPVATLESELERSDFLVANVGSLQSGSVGAGMVWT